MAYFKIAHLHTLVRSMNRSQIANFGMRDDRCWMYTVYSTLTDGPAAASQKLTSITPRLQRCNAALHCPACRARLHAKQCDHQRRFHSRCHPVFPVSNTVASDFFHHSSGAGSARFEKRRLHVSPIITHSSANKAFTAPVRRRHRLASIQSIGSPKHWLLSGPTSGMLASHVGKSVCRALRGLIAAPQSLAAVHSSEDVLPGVASPASEPCCSGRGIATDSRPSHGLFQYHRDSIRRPADTWSARRLAVRSSC